MLIVVVDSPSVLSACLPSPARLREDDFLELPLRHVRAQHEEEQEQEHDVDHRDQVREMLSSALP
jgi:hypothetical protein